MFLVARTIFRNDLRKDAVISLTFVHGDSNALGLYLSAQERNLNDMIKEETLDKLPKSFVRRRQDPPKAFSWATAKHTTWETSLDCVKDALGTNLRNSSDGYFLGHKCTYLYQHETITLDQLNAMLTA